MEIEFASEVRKAAGRPEVCAAVADLYARLQIEVDRRKPVCVSSGKCCHFEEYGHRLYVTTLELGKFLSEYQPRRPETPNLRSLPLAPTTISPGCPFQVDNLCSVHPIRPFGCRIFYCDPAATEWQQEQYEQFHTELKNLHDTLAVPYRYLEWREALKILGLTERAE